LIRARVDLLNTLSWTASIVVFIKSPKSLDMQQLLLQYIQLHKRVMQLPFAFETANSLDYSLGKSVCVFIKSLQDA
jgi:hypothetical protein